MQTILLWFFLINGLYMFRTFTCHSSGVLIYRLFHCRMWCYAIGVEAVVLRSLCVVLCTVCQLVSKIIVKLFASSWCIFLTYIYDAWSHLYHIFGWFCTFLESSWHLYRDDWYACPHGTTCLLLDWSETHCLVQKYSVLLEDHQVSQQFLTISRVAD